MKKRKYASASHDMTVIHAVKMSLWDVYYYIKGTWSFFKDLFWGIVKAIWHHKKKTAKK